MTSYAINWKDKELTEQISKYAFLQAELENMRKYYVKQQNLTQSRTKANVITSFTPLIDSFEMAFNNQISSDIDGNGNCSPQLERYIKGFEGIRKQLSDIFESYQVKAIDTKNIPFDYKEHEVMMRVLNDNLPEDTIMQIVQKGYKMNGEVIRPAKVVVSKITPPPAPEPVKETMPPEVSSSEKKAPPVNSEEITEGNQEVQEQGSPEIPKTL
jgi:molecular chaperone GrpE